MKNKIGKKEVVNAYRKLGFKVSLSRSGRTSVFEEFKSPIDGTVVISTSMFSTRPYDYDLLRDNLDMTIARINKFQGRSKIDK